MRKIISLTFLLVSFLLPIKFGTLLLSGCGSGNVQLEANEADGPGAGTEGDSTTDATSDCDNPAADLISTDMAATVHGDACTVPVATENVGETISFILECTDARTTDDGTTDYLEISCGTGVGENVASFFCSDAIVFQNDLGDGVSVADIVQVECTIDGDGVGTITAGELVIS